MDIDTLSGNDTTGGAGLLSKWRAKRTIRKREKAQDYLEKTSEPNTIMSLIRSFWLWIILGIVVVIFLSRMIFRKGSRVFRRRKHNSGRSFYLRMKRAKARKARK